MPINELLNFTAVADTRKFNAEITKSGKLQQKYQKSVLKGTQGIDRATKTLGGDLRKYETAVKKVVKSEEQRMTLLSSYAKKVESLEEDLLTATKTEAEGIRKTMDALEKKYKLALAGAAGYQKELLKIQEQDRELIKLEKERLAGQNAEVKGAKDLLTIREAIADMHERASARHKDALSDVAGFGGHEMTEGFKDSIGDALSSISSRDFGGFASSMMKALGTAGKGAGGGLLRAAAGGGAGGGGGAMAKLMASLGPTINMISKLAPIIATLSSTVMAVVKLFLDADAAAKDFNKEVLSTTSTSGYLAKNFGSATKAAEDLKSTMKDMYDQATATDNLGWGISKETHQQVEQALGAQGVMITKTEEYFDAIKKGRVANQGMVKDWGSMVQMSVGYSRAFGVSLSEVTDLQGELMSELGMGFDDVQEGFQKMAQGAEDAGIAGNKFFAQIRAVSSDISLFNMRIGDAAKIMSKLDKAMSPRKAAEFFQTITKFFKGMGLMDRAKMVLMAGTGKTKGILKKDLDQRVDALAKDLDKLGDGVGHDLTQSLGNKSQLVKFMAKHDKELSGEQRDAIMTASRQQQKIARGGIIDLASALKDASPFAAMDEIEAMSKRMFQKPIEELSGVQLAAVEQAAGINDEQIDQFAKLRGTLDVTQEQIAQKLDKGTKLTDEEAEMMRKLGINYKSGQEDTEAGDKLRHKDSKAVWDNMNKSQQDSLRDSAGTLDQAKRQGDLTQSLIDKLGVLMDFIMREVYNVLIDVWDTLLDFFNFWPFKDASYDVKKIEVAVAKTKNRDLMDVFQNAKGDMGKFKGDAIMKVLGPQLAKAMEASQSEYDKLGDQKKTETDPEKLKAIDKRMQELVDAKQADAQMLENQLDAQQQSALIADKGIGLTEEQTKKIQDQIDLAKGMGEKQDLNTAIIKSGITLDQKQSDEMMKKALWAMTPQQLANLQLKMPDATGTKGGAPAAAAPVQTGGAAGAGPQATPSPALQAGQSAGGAPAAAAPAQTGGAAGAGPQATPSPALQAGQSASSQPVTPSPALQAGQSASSQPVTPDDMKEATDQQGKDMAGTMDDLRLDMKKQSSGIVLNGPYLKNQYGGQIEDSVYNAASRALFEYYMYSDLKREDVANALKRGINPRDLGPSIVSELRKGQTTGSAADRGDIVKALKGNAEGGVVARPAPGEVLASVKPGERIVPAGAGGGGGTIRLELVGDLKRIIRAEAHNALNEAQRAAPRR